VVVVVNAEKGRGTGLVVIVVVVDWVVVVVVVVVVINSSDKEEDWWLALLEQIPLPSPHLRTLYLSHLWMVILSVQSRTCGTAIWESKEQ